MKKGWIIAISVAIFVIGLLVLLSFTLFSLKEVRVDYKTSFSEVINEEDLIDRGKFAYKGSVFFHGKSKYIENIERAYPNVKVVNIETVFPSTFVIHIAQRQEVFAILYNENYLICDNEFKVLRIASDFSSSQTSPILLQGIEIEDDNITVGSELKIEGYYDIYNSSLKNNRPLSSMQTILNTITFSQIYDEVLLTYQPAVTFTLYDGQKYIIKNCGYGLDGKMKLFYDVYSQIYTYIGQTIKIDGEEIVLSEENLKNATILIDNYYDYSQHDENDCYFNIVKLTNS